MQTKKLDHCGGECNCCWVTISWRSILLGTIFAFLLGIGAAHIILYWDNLSFFEMCHALVILLSLFIIRAWFTARLVTFLLPSDSIAENIVTLIMLTAIPGLGEVMFLSSGRNKALVRPFLIPHFDLSAFEVAQEIRKRDVFAKVTSDNTLTVYMDKQAIEVQINEENHSMCIGGEQMQICCLDDAADLAKIILAQKTKEGAYEGFVQV